MSLHPGATEADHTAETSEGSRGLQDTVGAADETNALDGIPADGVVVGVAGGGPLAPSRGVGGQFCLS